MKRFSLEDVGHRREASGQAYLEFIRVDSMSVGLYVLPAGGVDSQAPHTEDELYVVLSGQGRFTAGDETCDVEPGDTLFVPAFVPHRFHDITTDLQLVVVFSPPEGARGLGADPSPAAG